MQIISQYRSAVKISLSKGLGIDRFSHHRFRLQFMFIVISLLSTRSVHAQFPIALGTLLPGDTVCIIYDAKINENITSESVSVQGVMTADGPITVLSDDPDTATPDDRTLTPINLAFDYGDAPDPTYPTLLASDGARHVVHAGSTLRLGTLLDIDADGQPSAQGDGDDLAGSSDEDGVPFASSLVLGTMANIDVTASGAGLLNAWMDFNQDGDWDDPGEQIFIDVALAAGANSISFSVPSEATVGLTFARFRLNTAGGLAPTGLASDGEVEDYQVEIISNSFSVDDPMVAEADGHIIFTITRSVNTSNDTVDIILSAGTASAGVDYTDVTMAMDSSIGFAAGGALTKTISVPIIEDMIVETDETIIATLSNPVGGGLAKAMGTGTITNDDMATLSLAALNVTQNEGTGMVATDFTFSVTLDKEVQDGFAVAFNTNDGTATIADGDYQDNDNTLLFTGAASEVNNITVQVNHDSKVEADEVFEVALGALSGLSGKDPADILFSGSPINGTISNDDMATVNLAAVSTSQNEGTGGTTTDFIFSVTLDSTVQGGFDIAYTTSDNTASTMDGDYQDNDGTLIFTGTAGESKNITVKVNQDVKVEADELFDLALGALSNLGVGVDAADLSVSGTPMSGTITNDDMATLTLAAVDANKAEGAGGDSTDFTFSVTLDNPVQGGLTLAYKTDDNTALLANNDYVDNDGSLTFVGIASEVQMITVEVIDDAKVEGNELFDVVLGAISIFGTGIDVTDFSTNGSPISGIINNDDFSEIRLSGHGIEIVDGDITPQLLDGTDFDTICSMGMIMDSFYIENTGDGLLEVDQVTATALGTNAGAFQVSTPTYILSDTISKGDSILLKILFTPAVPGEDSVMVSIGNNDADENPYTFVVRGFAQMPPDEAVAGPDQMVCNSATTDLQATDPMVGKGMWSILSGMGGSVADPESPVSSFEGVLGATYVLRWTVTNAPCPPVHDDVTIALSANPPMPGAISGPTNICASIPNLTYSIPSGDNSQVYTWSFSDASATISGNGTRQVSISFDGSFSGGILSVTVTDICGTSSARTLSINKGSSTLCELYSCLSENEALIIDNTMINALDVFQNYNRIESGATINSPRNVTFKAGTAIVLNPPFEVQSGATFTAEIEACLESISHD